MKRKKRTRFEVWFISVKEFGLRAKIVYRKRILNISFYKSHSPFKLFLDHIVDQIEKTLRQRLVYFFDCFQKFFQLSEFFNIISVKSFSHYLQFSERDCLTYGTSHDYFLLCSQIRCWLQHIISSQSYYRQRKYHEITIQTIIDKAFCQGRQDG